MASDSPYDPDAPTWPGTRAHPPPPAEVPAPPVPEDTAWRMLHPLSLAVNLVPRTWAALRQLWPFFLVALFGGTLDGGSTADLVLVLLLTLAATSNTFVHYFTLRYRVAGGRLEIVSGLLHRNRRVLAPTRVQNVELVRNVFHRLTGLVEVRVETASGDDVEGLLSALDEAEAERIVRLLRPGATAAAAATEADDVVVVRNDTFDLLRYGAASVRVGAALLGAGLLFEYASRLDPERFQEATVALGGLGMVALFFVLLVAGWVVGIFNVLVRHHGFTLRLAGDRLVAEEGLFTRRRMELQLPKVQVVTVRQPLLRRLIGIASVVVDTAAARAGSGGTERAVTTVPVVPPEHVDDVIRTALPAADVRPMEAALRPADPRALRRALVRGTLQGVVLAGLVTALRFPWGALAFLLAPLPAVLGWLDWRHQGWLVTDTVVIARRGFLDRTTTVVARRKVQSVEVAQGPLQRRYGLGMVVLRVAGTAVPMPLLDHDAALALASQLSATVARAALAAPGAPPPSGPATPATT